MINNTPALETVAGVAFFRFDISNASTPEVYGFTKSFTASTIIYTVTVQNVGGANKYFINGEQQKTLEKYTKIMKSAMNQGLLCPFVPKLSGRSHGLQEPPGTPPDP